jgi:allantoin racemase
MRKIAFISGGYGPLSPELKRRHAILQAAASPGTRIDMYGGRGSVESREGEYTGNRELEAIESEFDLACSFPNEARICIDAEQERYDAIIMACAGDPGLFAIREAVSIPVVAPGTTARHICSLISHRFTLLTTGRAGPVRALLEHEQPHGLGRWVSTRSIGMGVLEVRKRPEDAFEAILRTAKDAMADEGSDAFTYGCMSMAFLDVDKRLEDALGVPFVNPAKVAVRMAEMYIDLGIRHSKLTFPTPPAVGIYTTNISPKELSSVHHSRCPPGRAWGL